RRGGRGGGAAALAADAAARIRGRTAARARDAPARQPGPARRGARARGAGIELGRRLSPCARGRGRPRPARARPRRLASHRARDPVGGFLLARAYRQAPGMNGKRDDGRKAKPAEDEGGSIPIDPELEAALREAMESVETEAAPAKPRASRAPDELHADPVSESEAEAVASRLREELADADERLLRLQAE